MINMKGDLIVSLHSLRLPPACHPVGYIKFVLEEILVLSYVLFFALTRSPGYDISVWGCKALLMALPAFQVRPTSIETSIRMIPCSGSVRQHMLTAYVRSFLMVLLAQFCSKGISGGGSGAAKLVCKSPPMQVT